MGLGWLWALNRSGESYRLSASSEKTECETSSAVWKYSPCEVPLRKLSASITCAWAIGSNSKPYLFVYQSDCACRISVEVYENQRWYPLVGYSSQLLPAERDVWTDEAGNKVSEPESHKLPSLGWQWEDPWTPDCNPRLADKEGWMYAANFSGPFRNRPFSTTFVRRRRWIRNRVYKAVEQWIKVDIPSAYKLIDIAVGGIDVPGQLTGFLCMWVLASNGKILFRSGIHRFKPEGELWLEIDTPPEVEFNQITCSHTDGRLWAVSWEGRLFRRTGQANTDYMGTDWAELDAPSEVRFLHVSLGDRCVWAITMDGNVWFAKLNTLDPEKPFSDNYWLDMNCSMSYLSIGPGDQVFGVRLEDGVILYRNGVTEKELSGHTWKPVVAEVEEKNVDENVEVETPSLNGEVVITVFDRPMNAIVGENRLDEIGLENRLDNFDHQEAPSIEPPMVVRYQKAKNGDVVWFGNGRGQDMDQRTTQDEGHEVAQEADNGISLETQSDGQYGLEESAIDEGQNPFYQADEERNPFHQDDAASETSSSGMSLMLPFVEKGVDALSEDDHSSSSNSLLRRRGLSSTRWLLVSAGGCILFNSFLGADGPPHDWFEVNSSSRGGSRNRRKVNYHKTHWRKVILSTLRQRNLAVLAAFSDFSFAFETGAWTRSVSAQIWSVYYGRWCDVVLRLTQPFRASESNRGDYGLVVQFNTTKARKYNGKTGRIGLDDILCVRRCFDTTINKATMVLFVKKIQGDAGVQWDLPLKFIFQSEEDQAAWTVAVDEAASKHQQNSTYREFNNSVWAVAHTGAVYVSRPGERCLIKDLTWRYIGGHFKLVEAGIDGLVWALGHDGRLWALTNSYLSSTDQQDDVVVDEVYENQRWSRLLIRYVPLPRLLFGAYYAWSDYTGLLDTPKDSFKLPGSEWHWVGDWKVDYSVDCDPEGWQYSRSFKRPFTGTKSMTRSNVRRRKWIRKRRVVTSSNVGMWRLVRPDDGANAVFSTVAIQPEGVQRGKGCRKEENFHNETGNEFPQTDRNQKEERGQNSLESRADTLIFAITLEGDLLCRLGVTPDQPEGVHWRQVTVGVPVRHVTIGLDQKIWVVGRNGFAYCCYSANEEDLLSSGWIEVPPPKGAYLREIACGNYAVYALSLDNRLFHRLGTTPWCPEGIEWVQIPSTSANVGHISVSKDNHLWALLKSGSGSNGSILARKYDIRGNDILWDLDWWDICNVDGWSHVSASGFGSSFCVRTNRGQTV